METETEVRMKHAHKTRLLNMNTLEKRPSFNSILNHIYI